MTTTSELLRQVDHLIDLECRVAAYRVEGKDPLVWLDRLAYERRAVHDQLERLTEGH